MTRGLLTTLRILGWSFKYHLYFLGIQRYDIYIYTIYIYIYCRVWCYMIPSTYISWNLIPGVSRALQKAAELFHVCDGNVPWKRWDPWNFPREWECPVNQPKSTKIRIENLFLSDSSKVSKVSNLTPIYKRSSPNFSGRKKSQAFLCFFFVPQKLCNRVERWFPPEKIARSLEQQMPQIGRSSSRWGT